MAISCACDIVDGDFAWYWLPADKRQPLATLRSRRCCSCKVSIKPGNEVRALNRFRYPISDIESRIYGFEGEVPLANWYHCKECADLQDFIEGMGWCFDIGDNLALALDEAAEAA